MIDCIQYILYNMYLFCNSARQSSLKGVIMKNDLNNIPVSLGDFADYLEWRKFREKNHCQQKEVSTSTLELMVSFYNSGSKLFVISKKSKMYGLSHKRNSGKLLCKTPGVSQGNKGITLIVSYSIFGLIGLKIENTRIIKWITVPVNEVHSVYTDFSVKEKMVIGRVNNVLELGPKI